MITFISKTANSVDFAKLLAPLFIENIEGIFVAIGVYI